jgi:hypothetical protein
MPRGVGEATVYMTRSSGPSPDQIASDIIDVVGLIGGSDPGRRLRWLLGFLEREVPDGAAAVAAFRELSVFCMLGGIGTQTSPREAEARDWALMGKSSKAASVIQGMQALVRDALRSLVEHGRCELPFHVELWIWRPGDARLDLRAGGPVRNRIVAAIYSLLADVGAERLGLCSNPNCRRIFVREGRQTYCGPRCSQRIRTERFKVRHPERVSDVRHEVHERRQRARLGSRVKVERKPRSGGKHRTL